MKIHYTIKYYQKISKLWDFLEDTFKIDYVCLHIFGSKMDHSCSREEEEEAFKKQVMHDRKSNFRNGQLVPMDRALSHLQTNVGSLLF